MVARMKIYCISLARAYIRREWMVNQFSAMGWDYSLVDAFDAQRADHMEDLSADPKVFKLLFNRDVIPGEIACYHSHMKALEMIVGSQESHGIIIEDDVELNASPNDVLTLGGRAWGHGARLFDILYLHEPFMGPVRVTNITPHYIELKEGYVGTQFYMVSWGFAAMMLQNKFTMIRPIDEEYRYMSRRGDIRCCAAKKPLGKHRHKDYGSFINPTS